MDLNKKLISETPAVSEVRLYQSLTELCAIGNRWPGTGGETAACEYIQSSMESWADTVTVEEFDYPHYTPISSSVSILFPVQRSIPSVGLQYSGTGEAQGRLVYVGEGNEDDFLCLVEAGCELKGKIVLAKTNRPYHVALYAERYMPTGLIIISDSPFGTLRQITSRMGFEEGEDLLDFGISIPGAIIDRSSGERLLSLLSSGIVEVSVEHSSNVDLRKSWNIIGNLQGTEKSELLIGAHYDTQLGIQGAWDNASGCSALLEVLRACSGKKPKRTMRFCAFGCEEIGLFGSTNYVRRRVEARDKMLCYMNLDSTSADVCTTHELLATKNMLDFAVEMIIGNTDWKITQFREFVPADYEQDSAEFIKQGINAIWIHEEGNPFFHTRYDTLETIDKGKLARAVRVSLLLFNYLAKCEEEGFDW